MASSGEGRGTKSDGLRPCRTGLFACLCALASFNAFADPYAQSFQAIFLAVGGGFLACIVVELAAGRGGWGRRAAIGVAFAILDVVVYLAILSILIKAGPLMVWVLAAWVIPAARLYWLLDKRPPRR